MNMSNSLATTYDYYQELYTDSLSLLDELLTGYGNKPTMEQREALADILRHYTGLVSGQMQGRFAFGLPTGLGKTTSILAFLTTLTKMEMDEGVAICQNTVEHLCKLKRKLEKLGVPSEQICLVHSLQYDPKVAADYLNGKSALPKGYASLPSCEDRLDGKQILLLTQQRTKGNASSDTYNIYHGRPRKLVIWDESLLVSNTFMFYDRLIASALGKFEPLISMASGRVEAFRYLQNCYSMIKKEIERQQNDPHMFKEAQTVHFPPLDESHVELYKAALSVAGDPESELLCNLLSVSQEDFRVLANLEQGDGAVTYQVVVPQELGNIVVLDASYSIRELARLDRSVQEVALDKGLIDYNDVTIFQMKHPSGRHAMEEAFFKQRGRAITKEIVDVIKEIPLNEAMLFVVFNPRGRMNYIDTLKRDLKKYRVDTSAMITMPDGKKKPRVNVITWGQETSISVYSYCSNVLLIGVLHRSHLDISSAICGQSQDLLLPLLNKDVRRVAQSEACHCIYQALSRGSSRVIEGRKARPMKAWIIYPTEEIRNVINEVMPGVVWKDWQPQYLLKIQEAKVKPISEVIMAYLLNLADDVTKVSTRVIKNATNLYNVTSRTFTRAVERASDQCPGWTLEGRSMVRQSCPFSEIPSENKLMQEVGLT